MNGAHRLAPFACIQESSTDIQYMQNTQQTLESVPGGRWCIYICLIILDIEADDCKIVLQCIRCICYCRKSVLLSTRL